MNIAIQCSLFPEIVPAQEIRNERKRFYSPVMYLNKAKWDNYLLNIICSCLLSFGFVQGTNRILAQQMEITRREERMEIEETNARGYRKWTLRDFDGKKAFTHFYMKHDGTDFKSYQDTLWVCQN